MADVRSYSRARKVDAVGWIIFFIWVVAAIFIKGIPRGMGSLGIGILTLGIALARYLFGVSVTISWLLIGAAFVIAGIGEMAGSTLPLMPIALILCGVLILMNSVIKGKRKGSSKENQKL